jgi:hypothetical protein
MSALLSLYNVAHFFAFSCSNVRLFVVAFFSSSLVQWTEVDVSSRSTTDHRKLCLLLDSIRKTSLPLASSTMCCHLQQLRTHLAPHRPLLAEGCMQF